MKAEDFLDDIPLDLAVRAFSNTSHYPEKLGERARNDYANGMAADYEHMRKEAETGGTVDMLETEFKRYRAGSVSRYRAWLESNSRCASSFIVGPANFPTRRAEKLNEIASRRIQEISDFKKRGMDAALRNLRSDLRPIMRGDADALERLEAELAKLEARKQEIKSQPSHLMASIQNINARRRIPPERSA